MPVKWWLNCRKPSVQYNTTTFQASAASQPKESHSAQCTAALRATGKSTTTDQVSQPWRISPVSAWRTTQITQLRTRP